MGRRDGLWNGQRHGRNAAMGNRLTIRCIRVSTDNAWKNRDNSIPVVASSCRTVEDVRSSTRRRYYCSVELANAKLAVFEGILSRLPPQLSRASCRGSWGGRSRLRASCFWALCHGRLTSRRSHPPPDDPVPRCGRDRGKLVAVFPTLPPKNVDARHKAGHDGRVCGVLSRLPGGGALVLKDRAEQLPAFAVEAHHLQLLVHAIVGW